MFTNDENTIDPAMDFIGSIYDTPEWSAEADADPPFLAAEIAAGKELARRELARRDYLGYLLYVNEGAFKRTRMASYLARAVQEFIETPTGHAYDILVVNCPPQHGKSMTITESLPSWYLGKFPRNHVIVVSYDSDYAERFSKKNRSKIRTYGKRLFGIDIGAVDRSSEFELSNGAGRFIARGIISGITGNPANLIIIDDPVKNRLEADSDTYRQRVWDEWQSSIKSRLAAGSKVIIIMTPWREDCFDRVILQNEKNVKHIALPVEALENDPLGRAPGEALCPEIGKDNQWLQEFKAGYINDPNGGARSWAAMYMCSPKVMEGDLISRSWWRYYSPHGALPAFDSTVISVDATFKGSDTSDFVAIQVWSRAGNDFYLRCSVNRHLNFPETVEEIRTVSSLYPEARPILIEEAANGAAIIATLSSSMFILPVKPRGGKVARVNAISSVIETGHVYVPYEHEAPWVGEYIEQFSTFPNAAHDDMVDSTSQALTYFISHGCAAAEEYKDTLEGKSAQEALYDVYSRDYL